MMVEWGNTPEGKVPLCMNFIDVIFEESFLFGGELTLVEVAGAEVNSIQMAKIFNLLQTNKMDILIRFLTKPTEHLLPYNLVWRKYYYLHQIGVSYWDIYHQKASFYFRQTVFEL